MSSFRPLHALVVLLTLWTSFTFAHAPVSRALKRIANPSTLSLEIIPRAPVPLAASEHRRRLPSPHTNTLRYDDSFRLILSAFDETFFLHLRPNDDLIHPKARINYYSTGPDGRSFIKYSKPLFRESVRAYLGEVVAADHSYTRMREDAARIIPDRTHPAHLGWARLVVYDQGDADAGVAPEFEGAFSVKGDVYHIMTMHNYLRTKHDLDTEDIEVVDVGLDSNLVIYRESDMMTPEEEHLTRTGERPVGKVDVKHGCGHDRLRYNTDPLQNPLLVKAPQPLTRWYDNPFGIFGNGSLAPRDDIPSNSATENFRDFIGSTNGCPTSPKIALLGVAADCAYVTSLGTQENATRQMLTSFNTASTLYKNTFNVSLGILHLAVQEPNCPSTPDPNVPWNVGCGNVTLEDRLSLFSQWRGQQGNDSTALWHLMSGCPTGTEVGIAWLGTLCNQQASPNQQGEIVSGTAVSTSGRTEWQVVAHETGHNFGAIHDCTSDGCVTNPACCPISSTSCDAGGQFLMSPVAQTGEQNFSPCSIGNVCTSMIGTGGTRTQTSCLIDANTNIQLVGLQMCGNGIVEQGEDCDPGQGINSTCSSVVQINARLPQAPKYVGLRGIPTAISPRCARVTRQLVLQTKPLLMARVVEATDSRVRVESVPPYLFNANRLVAPWGFQKLVPTLQVPTARFLVKIPTRRINVVFSPHSLLTDPHVYITNQYDDRVRRYLHGEDNAWYTQNLQIAIPVTIVAGLVALLLLWAIIRAVRRCCFGRRPSQTTTFVATVPPAMSTQHHRRLSSYDRNAPGYVSSPNVLGRGNGPVYSPVPQQQSQWGPPPQHPTRTPWVDDTLYNGPRHS
ncbi:hypothetical protein NP233_g9304 [Leucocoprinus birnbaumii]|uniref:Peptidase M12B domain-containing protein n=1 Tax=Leucocoprinus birnbaumii TaxID=56174 RepID=A0AAD5VMD5_9AGAR|nr:hypothetical protein NP233_g9304 [Leucocoprinus birnbaumii]